MPRALTPRLHIGQQRQNPFPVLSIGTHHGVEGDPWPSTDWFFHGKSVGGSCSILGNNDLMLISHIFSWKWDPWSATRPHCVQLPHQQAALAVLYASYPLRLNHSRVPPESFYVHCIHDTHLGQCHRPASCWAYWQPVQRPHVCRRVVPSWGLWRRRRGLRWAQGSRTFTPNHWILDGLGIGNALGYKHPQNSDICGSQIPFQTASL